MSDNTKARAADPFARFADHASAMGVPPEVVADAAAHTFDMLDTEQQVELVEEALERWKAHQFLRAATATVVFAEKRNQMRDDMVYRLQHEHFDLVYALAVRMEDSPDGPTEAQWLMVPPRKAEDETPDSRVSMAMDKLIRMLRHARRGFENVRLMHGSKR